MAGQANRPYLEGNPIHSKNRQLQEMKKLILLFALLICGISFAQQPDRSVTVDAIKFRQGTSTTRDTYVVPATETWMFDNSTTGTLQINRGGAGWTTFTGGLVDGDYGDIVISGSGTVVSIDSGVIVAGDIANNAITDQKILNEAVTLPKLDSSNTPTDGYIPTANASGQNLTWIDPATLADGTGTDDQTAAEVSIADAGGIITATTVEDALQENRTAIDLNTAKATNATHTGEVTGSGALTIASGVVDSDNIVNGTIDEADLDTSVNASLDLADASIQNNSVNNVTGTLNITDTTDGAGIIVNASTNETTLKGGSSGGGTTTQLVIGPNSMLLTGYTTAEQEAAGSTSLVTKEYVDANPGGVAGTIPTFTGTTLLGAMIQTEAQQDSDGAPPTGYASLCSDCDPAKVIATATIAMEGWKMYDDQTADAATITLSDCEPGETLTVYINRAGAPTLAGTGLTFNQLPNTTAFAAATEMGIYFEVAYNGTTIDYYYFER